MDIYVFCTGVLSESVICILSEGMQPTSLSSNVKALHLIADAQSVAVSLLNVQVLLKDPTDCCGVTLTPNVCMVGAGSSVLCSGRPPLF